MLIKNGSIIKTDKGVNLSNKDIYVEAMNTDFDYFIYHTRVASVGNISDNNCHPFSVENGEFSWVMNGTETGIISHLANDIGITDTEFVLRMFSQMNLPTDMLEEFSARYMGIRDGKIFIKNTNFNSLEFIRYTDGGFIVASNFPFYNDVKVMKDGMWFEGETLIGSDKTEPKYVSYKSNKFTRNWDNDKEWNKSFATNDYEVCGNDYSWTEDEYERLQYGYGYEDEDWYKIWKEKKQALGECK